MGRSSSSSSSSLKVKSTTCGGGLFWLDRGMLGVTLCEPFCVAVTGVASRVARGSEEVVSRFSFGVNRSVISTKSSSESGLAWPLFSGSSFLSACQTPFGSIVTCSKSVDVECKMSSTYLYIRLVPNPRSVKARNHLLVNL